MVASQFPSDDRAQACVHDGTVQVDAAGSDSSSDGGPEEGGLQALIVSTPPHLEQPPERSRQELRVPTAALLPPSRSGSVGAHAVTVINC